MMRLSHLTDDELIRRVYASQETTELERELANRLANALDKVEELEERFVELLDTVEDLKQRAELFWRRDLQ